MSSHARSRRQDIDSGMLVGDPDDLIDIHIVKTADLCQFVGKGNVNVTEGIFHHLGHLCRADICHYDLPFAEGTV